MKTMRLIDGSAIEVVSYVQYVNGREFPWMGYHDGIIQFFKTQVDALHFARTGKVI